MLVALQSRFLRWLVALPTLALALFFPALGRPPGTSGRRSEDIGSPERARVSTSREQPSLLLGSGTLRFGFEIRTRTEFWHNYTIRRPSLGIDDQALLLRSKLLAEYRSGEGGVRLLLELQDSRYWGSQLAIHDFPRTCPFADHLDLRRAFIETPLLENGLLSAKLGRQAIAYADKRVFGPGDWGNVGRYWWDAAKISLRLGASRTDLLWGRRVIREPLRFDESHDPYDMFGAYTIIPWGAGEVHLFLLQRREHHPTVGESGEGRTRVRTGGMYLHISASPRCDVRGTLAIESGRRGSDPLLAWGGNLRVRYRLSSSWRPFLGAELTVASGDRDPHDGKNGTFDGVFGSVSSPYGRMKLFSWKNLRDYQLTVGFRPASGLDLWLDYHDFRLDAARDAWYWCSGKAVLRDPTGRHGRKLGRELDLLVKSRLDEHWEIFAGGGIFRAGEFPAQDPSLPRCMAWGFLQVSYRL